MEMKYKLGDELTIRFYDHMSETPIWHDKQYISKVPTPIGSAKGFFIEEDEISIKIASMVMFDNKGRITDMGSCHIIVKGAIIDIKNT